MLQQPAAKLGGYCISSQTPHPPGHLGSTFAGTLLSQCAARLSSTSLSQNVKRADECFARCFNNQLPSWGDDESALKLHTRTYTRSNFVAVRWNILRGAPQPQWRTGACFARCFNSSQPKLYQLSNSTTTRARSFRQEPCARKSTTTIWQARSQNWDITQRDNYLGG
jgi:hypothetical protein